MTPSRIALLLCLPLSGLVPSADPMPPANGDAGFSPELEPGWATSADTVVRVRPGDRVVFDGMEGRLTVAGWSRDEMEIRSDTETTPVTIRRTGSTLRVEAGDRKGRRRTLDVAVRLPPSTDVEVNGLSLELVVQEMAGRIDVDNVSGDVWIEDAAGPVTVRTIEGEIDVVRATAGVSVSSQSDDVRLRSVAGAVDAHSGDGDIELMDVRSASVRAETQDGDIDFSGTVEDGGEYGFFVHDGDATVAIPADARVRVQVSTFDGEFESDFPVVLERFTGGREFDFTVGEPRARMEIQVFDGEIRLLERR